MKRLFISQLMNGKSDEEILQRRSEIIAEASKIAKCDIEVVDSFFVFPAGTHPLMYLGKSIMLLSTADLAYFDKGWQEGRGTVIEHECALRYGIEIIHD